MTTHLCSTNETKSVVVCYSMGLDSTTLAYLYKSLGYHVTLAYFDDGPWNAPTDSFFDHTRPVDYSRFMSEESDFYADWHARHAGDLNTKQLGFDVVKLRFPQLNALHAVVPPDNASAEYAEGLGLHFWVGFKQLMAMILMSYGAAHKKDLIVFGHLLEDDAYYDENPLPFQQLYDFMVRTYQRVVIPRVANPYCDWQFDKLNILRVATKLNVPLSHTYSCRRTPAVRQDDGRYVHCGVCENCQRRLAAFKKFGMTDPAPYDGGDNVPT